MYNLYERLFLQETIYLKTKSTSDNKKLIVKYLHYPYKYVYLS
jgi:hypothetical protein